MIALVPPIGTKNPIWGVLAHGLIYLIIKATVELIFTMCETFQWINLLVFEPAKGQVVYRFL